MNSVRCSLTAFIAAVLTWGTIPSVAAQQASNVVQARVSVAPPPVLFENLRDLTFGMVSPGQVVAVTALGPHAGGTISAGVRFTNLRKQNTHTLRFTLPSDLTNGSGTIPVAWAGTQFGSFCMWADNPGSCVVPAVAFSPAAHVLVPLSVTIPNNSPGNNFSGDVYIGGVLTVPGSGVTPGTYTGTITIHLTIIS